MEIHKIDTIVMASCVGVSIVLGLIGCWCPTVLGLNIPVFIVFIIALDN